MRCFALALLVFLLGGCGTDSDSTKPAADPQSPDPQTSPGDQATSKTTQEVGKMAKNLTWIQAEDPAMVAAIRAAQETFPEFAREAELENFRIVPAFEDIAIKTFFPDPARPGYGEHMFLSDVATDGQTITATLDSEPNFESDLREGQQVTFPIANLSDWFLVTDGQGIGGFTIDVLWNRFSAAEREQYQDYPPYAWFAHRTTDAQTELNAVPVCTNCGQREIHARSYRDGVCGLCVNGATRSNCPDCNAPLIRYPDAPEKCHRCLSASAN